MRVKSYFWDIRPKNKKKKQFYVKNNYQASESKKYSTRISNQTARMKKIHRVKNT